MIGWLSDWLRDIIAVILLAVLVELLLPNKAMQRYARLVVGLFILLTLLSPVLRLIQEDVGDRLEAGMRLWDERAMERKVQMPSLEEIQRRANEMQEQRTAEAARLTERTLEAAMAEELRGQAALNVEAVSVKLVWDASGKSGKPPQIGAVTVTLAPRQQPAEAGAGPGGGERGIAEVEPVAVSVRIEAADAAAADGGALAAAPDETAAGYGAVGEADAAAVWGVLKHGWGVARDQVMIRQRAAD